MKELAFPDEKGVMAAKSDPRVKLQKCWLRTESNQLEAGWVTRRNGGQFGGWESCCYAREERPGSASEVATGP